MTPPTASPPDEILGILAETSATDVFKYCKESMSAFLKGLTLTQEVPLQIQVRDGLKQSLLTKGGHGRS